MLNECVCVMRNSVSRCWSSLRQCRHAYVRIGVPGREGKHAADAREDGGKQAVVHVRRRLVICLLTAVAPALLVARSVFLRRLVRCLTREAHVKQLEVHREHVIGQRRIVRREECLIHRQHAVIRGVLVALRLASVRYLRV